LIGVGLVVRGAHMVRLGGEQLHPVAQIVRANESVEVAFESGLIGCCRRLRAYAKKACGCERDDSAL
jgi:hypothetical protein